MTDAVNLRAAWWGQSYGYPATLAGARACMRRHGSWTFMAFIARCAKRADQAGFRPTYDLPRFDEIVRSEAIADTLRRFPA
jgi:hypothetical protein